VLGAAHYLDDLGFAKNPKKALMSYNAGPGNWQAAGDYAEKVFRAAGAKFGYKPGGGGAASAVAPTGPTARRGGGDSGKTDVLNMLASLSKPGSSAQQNYALLSTIMEPESTGDVPLSPGPERGMEALETPAGGPLSAFEMKQQLLKKFPGLETSSSSRPGAITQSGNPSMHGMKAGGHTRAFDLSGPKNVMDEAAAYAYKQFGPQVSEMFYDPLGYYWKKGKKVKGAIGGHSDHFHLGV
jgi:hypothetical protein